MKKKRVLFIFHQKNFIGGASKSLLDILESLKKENRFEILVLLPGRGEISKKLDQKEIKYIQSFYLSAMRTKTFKGFFKKIFVICFNKLFFIIAYKKVIKNKIDLIYSNTSTIDIGHYFNKFLNKQHIIHVREFGEEDHGLMHIHSIKKIEKMYKNKKNMYIVISKELERKYERIIPRERLKLVYNGIEDKFFVKKYKNKNKINFLLIGAVQSGKNQLEALKAAKVLKDKDIHNFKINFVGSENKNYKKILENYIKENSLEKYIEFLGNKNFEELKILIQKFDVGLMLSLKEAFGRVTIEYMLGGMPVIASNTGANPELIRENQNGYLYNIGDIDSLAQKLELFIKDNLKIKEIGVKAREIALQNYLAETNYQKIKKVIDSQIQ